MMISKGFGLAGDYNWWYNFILIYTPQSIDPWSLSAGVSIWSTDPKHCSTKAKSHTIWPNYNLSPT